MKIFVTGGKGDLGRRVVPRLTAAGHVVVVGTRSPTDRTDDATEVRYDLDSDRSLAEALDGVDTIVHLASDPFRSGRDVTGTDRLVKAASLQNIRHLLYVSIVGIDDHPYPYYRSKLACEQTIERSEVGWTILRATQFHSLTKNFALQFRRSPAVLFPSGIPFQPIDANVVADRVAELAASSPQGRVDDMGGPEVLDFKESIKRYLQATGSRKPVWSLPAFGRSIRAFRSGKLLTPNMASGRTFEEWLGTVEQQASHRVGHGKAIESDLTISARPDQVWEVLTDFDAYPAWNPFITKMEVQLGEGAPFRAMSRLPAGIRLGFVGTVLSVVREKELSWSGRPTIMPGSAMTVKHTFTLEPVPEGTHLHQLEEATGFMIPVSGWILGQAQKGQVALNEAIQRRLTET